MAEEEAEQQPPMNHIEMTHACTECDEDCETACENGTCKLTREDGEPSKIKGSALRDGEATISCDGRLALRRE